MNKKIASEIAIGIIIIVALAISAIIYFANEKSTENSEVVAEEKKSKQETVLKSKEYYDEFRKKCEGSGCCLSSVDGAEKEGSLIYEGDGNTYASCPDGTSIEMLKCVDSYQWCSPNKAACSQDAKQCPDGSYVSRTGPNCEFAQCSEKDALKWETYRSMEYGFEFKYPAGWIIDELNTEKLKETSKRPIWIELRFKSPDYSESEDGNRIIGGAVLSLSASSTIRNPVNCAGYEGLVLETCPAGKDNKGDVYKIDNIVGFRDSSGIMFFRNNISYWLIISRNSEIEGDENILDGVISSFKFIK